MSEAILELNDQALLIQTDGGALVAEPGCARLTYEGVITGGEALSRAWLEPQHTHDQYWAKLGTAPLALPHPWARHNADIAYAQLRALWQQAGEPDALLLLVPGSFSDAQLSILLGMAEALPARVLGIVDSALAACWHATGDVLYVDMQLRHTVVSRCVRSPGRVTIVDQEILPDLGMAQLGNTLARQVSDLLIESHRYDPLHTSEHEQEIFDEVPGWLGHLRWESELSASLETDLGPLAFVLRREEVAHGMEERLSNLYSFARRHADTRTVLSHASAPLVGVAPAFKGATVAGQTVCMDNGFELLGQLPDPGGGLTRMSALRTATESDTERGPTVLATHLLCGTRALPLASPVSVRLETGQPRLSRGIDREAALSLVLQDGMLEALHHAPEAEAQLPPTGAPGGEVVLSGHRMQLIEVRDG
ncbi:MAG: hypothetical protein AAGH19_05210 [Pseudomonadota bacterium]